MLVVVLTDPAAEVVADRVVRQLGGLPERAQVRPVEHEVGDTVATLQHLSRLASEAAERGEAMAVVHGGLVVPAALLAILLDDPRETSRALVGPVPERPAAVHDRGTGTVLVRDGQVLAAGTEVHELPEPSGVFLGAVHVAAADVGTVAQALEVARVVGLVGSWRTLDVASLVLTSVVRAGVEVRAVPLAPFPGGWALAGQEVDELRTPVDGCDETALRWRRATRANDGFFSTFVLRRVSRRLTPVVHRAGMTPNAVTVASFAIAVGAAAAFAEGSRLGLVLGAVLFLGSLLVDCVDGELARFTRNFTALGAWLDAFTDRVKEYGVIAALALGAARHGEDLWLLAGIALALQTVKHMQDFSFAETVLLDRRRPVADTRTLAHLTWTSLGAEPDGRADRVERWSQRTGRRRAVYWAKRVLHMPIGERWLVLALGAAVGGPVWALRVYVVAVSLALAWTTAGWVMRSLAAPGALAGHVREALRDLRDDGPLGRTAPLREAAGRGVALTWLLPPAVTAVDAVVSVGLAALVAPDALPWAYLWFFAVAWRRYDVFYRRRDRGVGPGRPVSVLGGGWPLRALALAVAAALGAQVLTGVLVVGSLWLLVLFGVDAVRVAGSTRGSSRVAGPTPAGAGLPGPGGAA